ncbi:MAG: hypothetical protein R6U96_03800 [Promethearchaeia archaeon]
MNLTETLMMDFGNNTALNSLKSLKKYLWTDAFAVYNFIELYKCTDKNKYNQLAFDLVDQVHGTLGSPKKMIGRKGWLASKVYPTKRSFRIGKLSQKEKRMDRLINI